jgi:hypothetical protein
MKHVLFYGFVSALIGAVLVLVLYFTGFHSDVSKLGVASVIGNIAGLVITVSCMVLGTKAVRDDTPPEEDFGYGRALWASFRISLVSTFLYGVFNFCYVSFINPGFIDIMVQGQMAKLEAKGVSGPALDNAEAMTRKFMQPVPAFIFVLLIGTLFGLVLSLIVAAVLKRKTPVTATPPLV